jgi:hypothetical protein|tara:strand:- start:33941 stop:34438 length:498 start_codon:yes stop_codon:yes gene_type:complete
MRPTIPFGVGTGLYWSVDAASTFLLPYSTGGTEADIWFSPPVVDFADMPALYAPAVALGLAAGDDINALVVIDDGSAGFSIATNLVFLSLATGSPTLLALGVGPEDVLIVGGGAALSLALPGAAIGLAPGDDLNALDFHIVPEPALLTLMGSLLVLFTAVQRRRI